MQHSLFSPLYNAWHMLGTQWQRNYPAWKWYPIAVGVLALAIGYLLTWFFYTDGPGMAYLVIFAGAMVLSFAENSLRGAWWSLVNFVSMSTLTLAAILLFFIIPVLLGNIIGAIIGNEFRNDILFFCIPIIMLCLIIYLMTRFIVPWVKSCVPRNSFIGYSMIVGTCLFSFFPIVTVNCVSVFDSYDSGSFYRPIKEAALWTRYRSQIPNFSSLPVNFTVADAAGLLSGCGPKKIGFRKIDPVAVVILSSEKLQKIISEDKLKRSEFYGAMFNLKTHEPLSAWTKLKRPLKSSMVPTVSPICYWVSCAPSYSFKELPPELERALYK